MKAIAFIFIIAVTTASAVPRSRFGGLNRHRRSSEHIIDDCMLVTSEPGRYFFKSRGNDPTVCGVYLMTDPDKIIQLEFQYVDLPCDSGALVAFVDGWELNGGFFPSPGDHRLSMEDRVTEFCGLTRPARAFYSSQNAALVQYRVPIRSKGFSFVVNFLDNPTPCNVLMEGLKDVYTIRNYGKPTNCSVMSLFPAQISILSLSVGVSYPGDTFKIETGIMKKCEEQGLKDYVEISGGSGLAAPKLAHGQTFCGIDSYSDNDWEDYVDALVGDYIPHMQELPYFGPVAETVLCGISTVRLVSSGVYENSVSVAVRQATEQDLILPSIICPL